MDRYDTIIIGAGHNGLVCAAYLAQGGQRVHVIEASDKPGGLAARREFYPGFRTAIAHSVCHFPQKISEELRLGDHGFENTPGTIPTVGLSGDGDHVVVDGSTLTGTNDDDADAYRTYARLMQRFAGALAPFWLKSMPRVGKGSPGDMMTFAHVGLNLRRLGRNDMREFLRVFSLPMRDLMDEYFDSDLLKATLSWDGLIGSKLAPRSPNGAVLALLYRMAGRSGSGYTVSGVDRVIESLCASATAAGATIRYSTPVDRIIVDGNSDGLVASGVQLADGEKIAADRVISATDPKRTFFDLVGVEYLDIGFTNRIRRLRCDGYVAKLHLALDSLPEFHGLAQVDGRMIIAPDMDAIEFAFDDAKYGGCPEHPVLEIVVPSTRDATLAPDSQHVLSAHVMYVPCRLRGGWTDEARKQICERTIDTIARYAPRIREQIVFQEFLTPADLEQEYRVTGGHWHHAEFAMDQMLMMRPTYGAAQYATPIPGLFLCGAGCHPGGGITGAAGHNAAREILR